MSRGILVPMDDSPPSTAALEYALSNHSSDTITVLHAVELSTPALYAGGMSHTVNSEPEEEDAVEVTTEAENLAGQYGVEISTVIEKGPPARVINDHASENDMDQIVMGSHGRKGVNRLIFGSVAERVVRRAPVPVTIVR